MPEQVTELTVFDAPLMVAEKSARATDVQLSASEKVAVIVVDPVGALMASNVGAVASTVTVRVTVGDVLPETFTARKARLWTPSARAAVGVNFQVAEAVPQAVQVTPVLDSVAPSTPATTLATAAPSVAVPL